MLNVLRESFKQTPYLKIVLGVVGVGMILYLGTYFDCGGSVSNVEGDWAARVNGTQIPTRTFMDAARNLDRYYQQLFGTNFDQARAQLQIGTQALQQLIEREVILQDAKRLGLEASAREVANEIRSDPGFRDESGRFIGTEKYRELVERGYPGGVAAFERSIADQVLTRSWTDLVTQPVTVDDDELREAFLKRTVKTAIEYAIVPTADASAAPKSSADDAMLRRWYEEHLERFQRPEGRKVRYVHLERAARESGIEITESDVAQSYESNKSNYSHPEQRRARHILFRTEPSMSEEARRSLRNRAEQALDRAKRGEDFAVLAQELSGDPGSAARGGDLGWFGREQMVKPFADAAFSTSPGSFAPLTETDFGFHVIQVTDSRAAGVTPLAEATESIRRTLTLERAQQKLTDDAQRLRAEIGNAAGLEAVATREGLTIVSRVVTKGERLPELGTGPDFAGAVLQLSPGGLSAPLRTAAGLALVAVDEVVPAAPAPFDDVRDAVKTDLGKDQARQAALASARRALDGNSDFAAAVRSLRLEVQSSGDLAPGQDLPGAGGLPAEAEPRLFGAQVSVGDRGVIETPNGALLYRIARRDPFDPGRLEAEKVTLREELLKDKRERYRQEVLSRLMRRQEININYEIVHSVNS